MIELAEQAKENLAKIDKLSSEIDCIREATRKETERLKYGVYRVLIRQLEQERDEKLGRVEDSGETAIAEKEAEVVRLNTAVKRVERILEYLRLDPTKDLTVNSDDIKLHDKYHPLYKEDLGYLLDDAYLKIRLLIVENDKPKNKFSLIAMGKCLFYEDLLKLSRSYGTSWYTNSSYALETVVKDFPAVEEAKAWLNSHKAKLNLVGDYDSVKSEYEEAIQNYKPEDFESFLMARCTCGYFYTEFERPSISRHETLRCHRCETVLTLKTKVEKKGEHGNNSNSNQAPDGRNSCVPSGRGGKTQEVCG